MKSDLKQQIKQLLEKALKEMQNHRMDASKQLYMQAAMKTGSSVSDPAQISQMQDMISDFSYIHTRLEKDKKLDDVAIVRDQVQKNIISPAVQLEQQNELLASFDPREIPKPNPKDVKEVENDFINNLKGKGLDPKKGFDGLKPQTKDILISKHARKNGKPELADQMMNEAMFRDGGDNVKFINKIMDNAGNEMGITKLGPTTSVVLHGEEHGELNNAVQDIKSQQSNPDNPMARYLSGTLADKYDHNKLDELADKKVNDRYELNLEQANEDENDLKKEAAEPSKQTAPNPFQTRPNPNPGSK